MKSTPSSSTSARDRTDRTGLAIGLLVLSGFIGGVGSAVPIRNDVRRAHVETQQISARVRFEALGTQREAATGRPQAEAHGTLGPRESATRYLVAGGVDDADLCQARFVNDPSSAHSVYLWQLETQVLSVSPATTILQLRWSRSRTTQGQTETQEGDTRTITLGVGDYQVFDYVSAGPNSPSACTNLVVRVLADPVPQPDPQPMLAADLWLVDDPDPGQRWIHQQVKGRSGQALPFHLESLKWSPSGLRVGADTNAPSIGLQLRGTINATLRPDDLLDVSVRAIRSVTWGGARLDGEGQQDFRCAIAESAAILLPDPTGQAASDTLTAGHAALAHGVFAQGGRTIVDFARFFSRRQASLYVRVNRAP